MPFKYDLHGWFVGGVPAAELRTVVQAGLRLARQGLEQFKIVVEEYCVEFEPRVAMATVRIAR